MEYYYCIFNSLFTWFLLDFKQDESKYMDHADVNDDEVNSGSGATATTSKNNKKSKNSKNKVDIEIMQWTEYQELLIELVRSFPYIWNYKLDVKLRSSTNVSEAWQSILQDLGRKYTFWP